MFTASMYGTASAAKRAEDEYYEQRARELLAAEYERAGSRRFAELLREDDDIGDRDTRLAVDAIATVLRTAGHRDSAEQPSATEPTTDAFASACRDRSFVEWPVHRHFAIVPRDPTPDMLEAAPPPPRGDDAPREPSAWRCSCCGELLDELDSAWRWNGIVWQHHHADSSHVDAVDFGPPTAPREAAQEPTSARLSAKPLTWKEEPLSRAPGWREWVDQRMGFHISYAPEEDADERYIAAWGEGDPESFATVEEAKAWCQEQADLWVREIAVASDAHCEGAPLRPVTDDRHD